jgi:hypothetical protein
MSHLNVVCRSSISLLISHPLSTGMALNVDAAPDADLLAKRTAELDMREAACAAKEAELAAALARQAAIGESVKRGGDETVSLSIGGTLFTVTRGALTSTDDSFFTAQERSIRWTHR